MRKVSEVFNEHNGLLNESPAGSDDDVTRVTRRNKRVYEVNINEEYGYIGFQEVVWDEDEKTEKFVDLIFLDGSNADEYRGRDGYFLLPKTIVSRLADTFED